MRLGRAAAVAATVGILSGGCSSPEHTSSPIPRTSSDTADLKFQKEPATNFSASDCDNDPETWVSHIDSEPGDVEAQSDAHTIGLVANWEADGSPNFLLGVTIQGLGGAAYKLAIADSKSVVQEKIVDLDDGPYSKPLEGTENYDAVFSVRLGQDGSAYFTINCLPNFGFNGNRKSVPLDELPTIAPDTPSTQPTDTGLITV